MTPSGPFHSFRGEQAPLFLGDSMVLLDRYHAFVRDAAALEEILILLKSRLEEQDVLGWDSWGARQRKVVESKYLCSMVGGLGPAPRAGCCEPRTW